jgi:aminoglycoside phosphotransferase (APT) family kinase protein
MREVKSGLGRMPTERTLDWAARAIGAGAKIAQVLPLHGDQGPWRLSIDLRGATTEAVLRGGARAPTGRVWPFMVVTGAVALEAAERYGLPAPRLIAADLQGEETGGVATLETLVSGSTVWPSPPSAERLRAAGATLARVRAVVMTPTRHLPFRPRPIAVDDFAADRRAGRMATTPLLDAADRLVTARGLQDDKTAFVHGDVWPGNLIWSEDHLAALIDWKTAGVGSPGVDTGELRKQAAITFGPDAPDLVLDGWERAAGAKAREVPYWDAVAALNTTTELDMGAVATERRDAFLRAALARLGR